MSFGVYSVRVKHDEPDSRPFGVFAFGFAGSLVGRRFTNKRLSRRVARGRDDGTNRMTGCGFRSSRIGTATRVSQYGFFAGDVL